MTEIKILSGDHMVPRTRDTWEIASPGDVCKLDSAAAQVLISNGVAELVKRGPGRPRKS